MRARRGRAYPRDGGREIGGTGLVGVVDPAACEGWVPGFCRAEIMDPSAAVGEFVVEDIVRCTAVGITFMR